MPATISFAGTVCDTGISGTAEIAVHFLLVFAMERHVHRVKTYCPVVARVNENADVDIPHYLLSINYRIFIRSQIKLI